MKNSLKKCSFCLLSRGCGCCLRRKRKTRFLGLQKKGLIQCGLVGKREHATGQRLASRELINGAIIRCCAGGRKEHAILLCGLAAGLVGLLLALWASCWPCGLVASLAGWLALQALLASSSILFLFQFQH